MPWKKRVRCPGSWIPLITFDEVQFCRVCHKRYPYTQPHDVAPGHYAMAQFH